MNNRMTIREFTDAIEVSICEEFARRGLKAIPKRTLEFSVNEKNEIIAFQIDGNDFKFHILDHYAAYMDFMDDSADEEETMQWLVGKFIQNVLSDFRRYDVRSIMKELSNFEKHRDGILPRVCSAECNSEYLSDKPHFLFADNLACYYSVAVPRFGIVCIISNELLQNFHVDEETLREIAFSNLEKEGFCLIPFTPGDSKETLLSKFNMVQNGVDDSEMFNGKTVVLYAMTRKEMHYGASVVADQSMVRQAYEEIGEPFYVIPSSVHEVLLVPFSQVYDPTELLGYVKDVNSTIISIADRLADHVYLMDDLESFKVRCVL